MLVIADRGFPYWPMIETVDISLTDDLPTVLDVLAALRENFTIGQVYMAAEFCQENTEATQKQFQDALSEIPVAYEAHDVLKQRVPQVIGLIRTGDTVQYANMILVSA